MFKKAARKYAKTLYLTIATIAVLAMTHFAYSEAEKPAEPFSITYDGRDWKAYTDNDKIAFLEGFYQGAFYGALKDQAEPGADEGQTFSDAISVYYYPAGGVLEIASEEVDKFYSDENNLKIPIHKALVFIAKEKSNENMIKEESAQWLERARKYWGNK